MDKKKCIGLLTLLRFELPAAAGLSTLMGSVLALGNFPAGGMPCRGFCPRSAHCPDGWAGRTDRGRAGLAAGDSVQLPAEAKRAAGEPAGQL